MKASHEWVSRLGILVAVILSSIECYSLNVFADQSQLKSFSQQSGQSSSYFSTATSSGSQISDAFYESVKKRIRLADGRTVTCSIPRFSTTESGSSLIPHLSSIFQEEFLGDQSKKSETKTPLGSISISSRPSPPTGLQHLVPQLNLSNTPKADRALQALQNECAEYRTTVFLWQFCYKKYLRQFDDILTMTAAQKKAPEDIYAGYYQSYDPHTNTTKHDCDYERNSYNYFAVGYQSDFRPSFLYASKLYHSHPHILTPNHTMTNATVSFFPNSKILFFSQPVNVTDRGEVYLFLYIEDPPPALLGRTPLESNENREQQVEQTTVIANLQNSQNPPGSRKKLRFRIHRMVDAHFALLQVELSPTFIDLNLLAYSIKIVERPNDKYNAHNYGMIALYDNRYLYGDNFNALVRFASSDTILVQTYNSVILRRVAKVWNHHLIELEMPSDSEQIERENEENARINYQNTVEPSSQEKEEKQKELPEQFVYSIQVYMRKSEYKYSQSLILTRLNRFSGSLIFKRLQHQVRVGDTIIFATKRTAIPVRVVAVFHSIVQLDQSFTNFSGIIFIANSIESSHQTKSESNSTRKTLELLKGKSIKSFVPSGAKLEMPLSNSIFQRSDEQDSAIEFSELSEFNFEGNEKQQQQQRFMMFNLLDTTKFKSAWKLKLQFQDALESPSECVAVNFIGSILGKQSVVAVDMLNRTNIATTNKRFENVTLTNQVVWVLVDGTSIRVGFSSVISPSNQLLVLRRHNVNPPANPAGAIRFIRVAARQSFNVLIKQPLVGVLGEPIRFDILDPIIANPTAVVLQDSYGNGEMCPPIKGPRSFSVEFRCGQSFFSILSVTEPTPCRYHVTAETYLLCDLIEETYTLPPPPKHVNCVIDQK